MGRPAQMATRPSSTAESGRTTVHSTRPRRTAPARRSTPVPDPMLSLWATPRVEDRPSTEVMAGKPEGRRPSAIPAVWAPNASPRGVPMEFVASRSAPKAARLATSAPNPAYAPRSRRGQSLPPVMRLARLRRKAPAGNLGHAMQPANAPTGWTSFARRVAATPPRIASRLIRSAMQRAFAWRRRRSRVPLICAIRPARAAISRARRQRNARRQSRASAALADPSRTEVIARARRTARLAIASTAIVAIWRVRERVRPATSRRRPERARR
jgi:hypothetical protein